MVHGPAPAGRYGHAAVMIGTKFYVFGGQTDGEFFNDLWVFDVNTCAFASFSLAMSALELML